MNLSVVVSVTHLTRRAWSLSLVQYGLSWFHSVIFPFHGPPFPKHPERAAVNPAGFWWSHALPISPNRNDSFSCPRKCRASRTSTFCICVWENTAVAHVLQSEMQQPLSLFLQMRAWAALVTIRYILSMLSSLKPLPLTRYSLLPSWLKEISVLCHCCSPWRTECVCVTVGLSTAGALIR